MRVVPDDLSNLAVRANSSADHFFHRAEVWCIGDRWGRGVSNRARRRSMASGGAPRHFGRRSGGLSKLYPENKKIIMKQQQCLIQQTGLLTSREKKRPVFL